MKLQILYDNKAQEGFKSGWGFSCYIEANDKKILFDTGWNGFILEWNMKMAGIYPEDLDAVFISHSHWDHIGGLNHILCYTKNIDVYLPKSISLNLKNEIKSQANIIEVSQLQSVYGNIYTTGELGVKIKEQSMVIGTIKGNVIITGCAHPGLDSIIAKSRELGHIYGIIGGFHDSNIDILKGIKLITPCHCTQKIDEIKAKMPHSFLKGEAGMKFEF